MAESSWGVSLKHDVCRGQLVPAVPKNCPSVNETPLNQWMASGSDLDGSDYGGSGEQTAGIMGHQLSLGGSSTSSDELTQHLASLQAELGGLQQQEQELAQSHAANMKEFKARREALVKQLKDMGRIVGCANSWKPVPGSKQQQTLTNVAVSNATHSSASMHSTTSDLGIDLIAGQPSRDVYGVSPPAGSANQACIPQSSQGHTAQTNLGVGACGAATNKAAGGTKDGGGGGSGCYKSSGALSQKGGGSGGGKKGGAGFKAGLRLLTRTDLRGDLTGHMLKLLWPDDGTWWDGQVVSMDPTTHQAVILYPSTAEEEVINLMEGVGKKELAWPPPAEAPVPPPAFKPGKASMAKGGASAVGGAGGGQKRTGAGAASSGDSKKARGAAAAAASDAPASQGSQQSQTQRAQRLGMAGMGGTLGLMRPGPNMQPQQGHSRQPAHAQHPRKLQQGPQLQPQQQPPADCRSGAGLAQQAIAALMDDGLGEGARSQPPHPAQQPRTSQGQGPQLSEPHAHRQQHQEPQGQQQEQQQQQASYSVHQLLAMGAQAVGRRVMVYKHYPSQNWITGRITHNNGSVASVVYANRATEHINAATPTWIRFL